MYRKLKGRMAENEIDQKCIREALGKSQTYITQRMTGRKPWTMDDVYILCNLLDISNGEISVFFPPKGEGTVVRQLSSATFKKQAAS